MDGDPYRISNTAEMLKFRDEAGTTLKAGHFEQTGDIDLTGCTWAPIVGFTGVYDGGGYEIRGLTFTSSGNVNTAIRGFLSGTSQGAILRDIHLMTDQTIMLGRTAVADDERIRRYRISGIVMITTWMFGTYVGYVASSQALSFDPAAIGLDAAYPALFLTLMIGDLRADRRALRVALVGGTIGAGAVIAGQPGLAPVLATLAVLVAVPGLRRAAARTEGSA